jgi:sodium-dependent dicarboxylate transporter 2/3/5
MPASHESSIVPAVGRSTPPRIMGVPVDMLGLLLGPLLMLFWMYGVETNLPPPAHRLAGVMLLTVVWWICEPIPIPATGLLALALCVMFDAVSPDASQAGRGAQEAFARFADPALFFVIGGLFLGRGMTRHGLDRRFALRILNTPWASRSPVTLLAAIGVVVAALSMWVSNTGATAMVFPVTMGLIAVLSAGRGSAGLGFARSPATTALLLMTAYASSIGGVATPIGTTTNVVAMGLFSQPDYFGQRVDFLRWALVGLPLMLVMLLVVFGWLRVWSPRRAIDMRAMRDYLAQEQAKLGPWRRGEKNTMAVFAVVIALWITPGVLGLAGAADWAETYNERLPTEIIAVLAPVLLYLTPVDWRRREFSLEPADFLRIDWGTVVLFGAGLSLGNLMSTTGLAEALGAGVLALFPGAGPWAVALVAIAAAILLSDLMSNTATAATLIPVVFSLCREGQIDPLPPVMGVTFGASFGCALPVSTPPNAIVYGSGLVPMRRMIAAGVVLDVLTVAVIWGVLRLAFLFGWSPFSS